ncbi:hypothetical protein BE04_15500 [Sorangium cellulosum]|uniref:Uncharacterized protein n=2 Tax=Sorangium cellulosum TaxID=56 RepID=A0A150P2W9_SORCE|nr:hypothetical protein [Sorangium cellulosum]AGP39505.1 hypothetical protein SCE1572_36460 [Sorangium cellulosum So0157-2]KYF49751.1 hypothetical protein BE04_15500 [Sorangium cellulosum]
MARRRTGSLFRNDAGRLYVRVLVGDKDRESFPLDPKLTAEQAERHEALVVDVAVRLRASRNVTRDAIVALLERAAVGEGRALRDVIAAADVVCRCRTPTSGAARCASRRTRPAARAPGRCRPACRRRCAPGSRLAATGALRALFVNEDGERVSVEHAAERLRAHVQLVGIGRPQLFEDSGERQQVRAHDTRSTFITVALASGRSESRVADRTGRRSSVVSQRYRRAARTFAELGLGELVSLAEGIDPRARGQGKRRGKRHGGGWGGDSET